MRIILIGPPGSGKGTQAYWISTYYAIPHLATGDMLRAVVTQKSPLSRTIEAILRQGQFVPDALVMRLIRERINQVDCQRGFILDGFPRTLAQAEMLKDTEIQIDLVIELTASDEVIIERLSGRRVHPGSGRIYHIHHHPPRVPHQDDVTGEPLIQRTDDNAQVIKKRLAIYYEKTKPVGQYYQNWANSKDPAAPKYDALSCNHSIEAIRQHIANLIESCS
jgi:adenylate kinase